MNPDSDEEIDLLSFAALQRAPDSIRPPSIPPLKPSIVPPTIPTIAPTAVDAGATLPEPPVVTGASELPECAAEPEKDVLDPDWPRCRPKSTGRPKRKYKRVGDVPDLTEEQLERSPKLRKWRELERNKLNARAYRDRERQAKKIAADRKLKVCRACFRVYEQTDRRIQSPYCNKRCTRAWERVKHCFDGDAAWLYRVREARTVLLRPDQYPLEHRLAAEHLLTEAVPDKSPHVPREGTLMYALVKALNKLRAKWGPYAAEAIRQGLADTMLKPDMMSALGPMIRGDQ